MLSIEGPRKFAEAFTDGGLELSTPDEWLTGGTEPEFTLLFGSGCVAEVFDAEYPGIFTSLSDCSGSEGGNTWSGGAMISCLIFRFWGSLCCPTLVLAEEELEGRLGT
jgi:hypothetical protein